MLPYVLLSTVGGDVHIPSLHGAKKKLFVSLKSAGMKLVGVEVEGLFSVYLLLILSFRRVPSNLMIVDSLQVR